MIKAITVAFALAASALAGCASPAKSDGTPQNVTTVDAAPPTQVCRRELPTGSDIPRTHCESIAADPQRANDLTDAQRQMSREAAAATVQRVNSMGGGH